MLPICLRHIAFIAFSLMLCASTTYAKQLQILHTNDLHGFFKDTGTYPALGGYALIKSKMDELEHKADNENMLTIRLDAGDFMEGNLFYMANSARRSLNIMNHMEYDAVVIGNHDWLMGSKDLNLLLKDVPLNFAFLGANYRPKSIWNHVKKKLRPYHIIEKEGVRIGVIGLTTNSVLYSWRVKDAKIGKYKKPVKKYVDILRNEEKVDYVILLTHIGVKADKKVVASTTGVDLVIGGHTHASLHEPVIQKNKDDQDVLIFQAGSRGRFLGQAVFDITEDKKLKLINSKLIPMVKADNTEDKSVKEYVVDSQHALDKIYNQKWLSEVIGTSSSLLPNSSEENTYISQFVTDSIKDVAETDIAINTPRFGGAGLPPGPITRQMCFDIYPRVFDFKDKHGWNVYKIKLWGGLLKPLIRFVHRKDLPLNFSGLDFDLVQRRTRRGNIKYKMKNMRINGKKIRFFKTYSTAVPEGIVRGGVGITRLAKAILRGITRTSTPIWFAIMDRVEKLGEIGEAEESFNNDRPFIPGDIDLE